MSAISVAGDTSGSVTLQAPAVAGSTVLTLPTTSATLITDSSGILNIGSGQLYKDASGNVGIGTSSPASKLDVVGNISATGSLNTPNTFAYKNLLIDAGFTINQRGYVSAATLASGAYGHDRWKAGASGGDYSFTQLASNTQITIASGKSLIQVVEDKNVSGTSYVLSWTGTAQARYAVNSATPAGSYAASPIVITGQTAGTTMSVEFNTGTLSKPQLELGAVATSFDQRAYSQELAMCQRYYQVYGAPASETFTMVTIRGDFFALNLMFIVAMRTTPTVTLYAATSGTAGKIRQIDGAGSPQDVTATPQVSSVGISYVIATTVTGSHYGFSLNASAEL